MKHIGKYVLIFVLLSVSIIAGCGDNVANKAATGDKKEKEVVLRLWAAGDWLKGDESPGQKVIKEFNEKYKGQIRVEGKFAPWSEHNTAVQAAFTSNDLPDLFHMPLGSELNKMVAQKMIRPLDGTVSENWYKQFYPGAFAEGINRLEGKTYTWPITGPALQYMLYYNKDVLKNAGLNPEQPPTSWDELRSMMKTVTEKGKGDIFGLVYGGGDQGYTTRMIAGFAQGLDPTEGGEGFNLKSGKYTLDDKAWSEAVKFALSYKADGSILPSSYSLKHSEAGVLFGQGKAAFILDARWRMWQIKRDTPDASFGMSFVPTIDGKQPYSGYSLANSGGGLVMSATTPHPEAVGKFIEEAIASEKFYTHYLQGGVALTPLPKVNENKTNYPYPELESFAKIHNDVMRIHPNPLIRNPELAVVSAEIGGLGQSKVKPSLDEVLQIIMTGSEKNPNEKLKELNDKLNKGLKEGIEKSKGKGAKVSESDYIFPNWDPKKDYLEQDYKGLK